MVMVGYNVQMEAQMKVNRKRPTRSSALGLNKVLYNHLRKTLTNTRPLAILCLGIGVLHVFAEGAVPTPILVESTNKLKHRLLVLITVS